MNLIEQLGGYEKAKKHYLDMREAINQVYYSHSCEFKSQQLKQALLQYRRQHNIYEVGDKVVYIDDFMHGEIMVVSSVGEDEMFMDGGAKWCGDLTMVRHATPEEIQAGKRNV